MNIKSEASANTTKKALFRTNRKLRKKKEEGRTEDIIF